MPDLYILAGPNGTGKTTYYFSAIERNLISSQLPFLNVDLIARNETGGYTAESFARAEMIFRERIGNLITRKSDFMIESNLSKSSDYDWLKSMAKNGYNLFLYFLSTDDVNININRVSWRVKQGGHNIPLEIILHRYKLGHSYLKTNLNLFKEIYLIDNSSDEAIEKVAINSSGLAFMNGDLPKWCTQILEFYNKIYRKGN